MHQSKHRESFDTITIQLHNDLTSELDRWGSTKDKSRICCQDLPGKATEFSFKYLINFKRDSS